MKSREREHATVDLDGSAESRAIARMLAQQRTAKPELSRFDEDARLIYGEMSRPGLRLGAQFVHTAVYARGMEVRDTAHAIGSPLAWSKAVSTDTTNVLFVRPPSVVAKKHCIS